MHLPPLTQPTPPGLTLLRTVEVTGSTQVDLRAWLSTEEGWLRQDSCEDWPHMSALRACAQTAGRGRGDHVWVTPPRGAYLVSTVMRPQVPAARLGWLPLLVGLAVRDAVAEFLPGLRVALKWPNDVVVMAPGEAAGSQQGGGGLGRAQQGCQQEVQQSCGVPEGSAQERSVPEGSAQAPRCAPAGADTWEEVPGWGRSRKIAGVLVDVIPPAPGSAHASGARTDRDAATAADCAAPDAWSAHGPALIVGVGINVGQSRAELPVPWATSLHECGSPATVEDLVARVPARCRELIDSYEAAGGDVAASGALPLLREHMSTLGCHVRVDTPAGVLEGEVVDMTPELVVVTPQGERVTVSAGDVAHVRAAVTSSETM